MRPWRTVIVILGLIAVVAANNAYDRIVHRHSSRPVEFQVSNELPDLILTGGSTVRNRGSLFAVLAKVSDGGLLITHPSRPIQWQPLGVIAGMELVVDDDYDPSLDPDVASRLLELAYDEGRYTWRSHDLPYLVVHPDDPGEPATFRTFELDGAMIIVDQGTIAELTGDGDT